MVVVECLYSGSFEPGKKSIQQQQAESRILVGMLGWVIRKEYVETERDKQLPMVCRKAIQKIVEDAKAGDFQVFLAWGVRSLSDVEDERLALLQTLEREGITMLLLDMDRMALMTGGTLWNVHTAEPIDVPKEYYKAYEKKDRNRWKEERAAAQKAAKTAASQQEVE